MLHHYTTSHQLAGMRKLACYELKTRKIGKITPSKCSAHLEMHHMQNFKDFNLCHNNSSGAITLHVRNRTIKWFNWKIIIWLLICSCQSAVVWIYILTIYCTQFLWTLTSDISWHIKSCSHQSHAWMNRSLNCLTLPGICFAQATVLTRALSAIVVPIVMTRKMASLFCRLGIWLDGVPGVGRGSIFLSRSINSSTVIIHRDIEKKKMWLLKTFFFRGWSTLCSCCFLRKARTWWHGRFCTFNPHVQTMCFMTETIQVKKQRKVSKTMTAWQAMTVW